MAVGHYATGDIETEVAREWQADSPGADLAFLTEEVASVQRALEPGIEGSWDDGKAQISPWGFELAQIWLPVLLLHGRRDEAVPFSHGQWLNGPHSGRRGPGCSITRDTGCCGRTTSGRCTPGSLTDSEATRTAASRSAAALVSFCGYDVATGTR